MKHDRRNSNIIHEVLHILLPIHILLNMIFFSLHVTLNIQCGALADCLNKEIDKKQEPLICYFLKTLPGKPGK